jgi:hypothetical protein
LVNFCLWPDRSFVQKRKVAKVFDAAFLVTAVGQNSYGVVSAVFKNVTGFV